MAPAHGHTSRGRGSAPRLVGHAYSRLATTPTCAQVYTKVTPGNEYTVLGVHAHTEQGQAQAMRGEEAAELLHGHRYKKPKPLRNTTRHTSYKHTTPPGKKIQTHIVLEIAAPKSSRTNHKLTTATATTSNNWSTLRDRRVLAQGQTPSPLSEETADPLHPR